MSADQVPSTLRLNTFTAENVLPSDRYEHRTKHNTYGHLHIAQPPKLETRQTEPLQQYGRETGFQDQPLTFENQRSKTEPVLAVNSIDDVEINNLIQKLVREQCPPNTEVRFFDAAVLYDKGDFQEAVYFKDQIKSLVEASLKEELRIEMFDSEVFVQSNILVVKDVVRRCSVVLVYLTQNADSTRFQFFVEEAVAMTRLCGEELGIPPSKKFCIRPVHTLPQTKRRYETPVGLLTINGIEWFGKFDAYSRDKVVDIMKTAMHFRKTCEKKCRFQNKVPVKGRPNNRTYAPAYGAYDSFVSNGGVHGLPAYFPNEETHVFADPPPPYCSHVNQYPFQFNPSLERTFAKGITKPGNIKLTYDEQRGMQSNSGLCFQNSRQDFDRRGARNSFMIHQSSFNSQPTGPPPGAEEAIHMKHMTANLLTDSSAMHDFYQRVIQREIAPSQPSASYPKKEISEVRFYSEPSRNESTRGSTSYTVPAQSLQPKAYNYDSMAVPLNSTELLTNFSTHTTNPNVSMACRRQMMYSHESDQSFYTAHENSGAHFHGHTVARPHIDHEMTQLSQHYMPKTSISTSREVENVTDEQFIQPVTENVFTSKNSRCQIFNNDDWDERITHPHDPRFTEWFDNKLSLKTTDPEHLSKGFGEKYSRSVNQTRDSLLEQDNTPLPSELRVVSRVTGKLIVNPNLSTDDIEIDTETSVKVQNSRRNIQQTQRSLPETLRRGNGLLALFVLSK